jgi:hypothetical protein
MYLCYQLSNFYYVRMNGCWLTPSEQFLSYILGSYISQLYLGELYFDEMMMMISTLNFELDQHG